MTLKPELLAILCCPQCKGDLLYNAQLQTLTCKQCKLAYPIKDGIPILLVDQAHSLDAQQSAQ
ncbi:MAG: hypothetical protein C4326_13280 [Ignavibacteria bacterium]